MKKRLLFYFSGLFTLSLGISFSIEANLGVSPVSSLAYALTLITDISVGVMTLLSHTLFIVAQAILQKTMNLKHSIMQLMVAFLFGFLTDLTLFLVRLLPEPDHLVMRWVFLMISMVFVASGLFAYMNARLPSLPYDELTRVISERFQIRFSQAKVSSDLLSVGIAGLLCIVFIQSLGSIGIGTLVAAYFVGKINGTLRKYFQESVVQWLHIDIQDNMNEFEKQMSFHHERERLSS